MTDAPPVTLGPDEIAAHLARGREAYARQSWDDAYRCLSVVDEVMPLALDDLAHLAWASVLTARDDAFFATAERIHRAHDSANQTSAAARWAFWMGFRANAMGDRARAGAWHSRAERLAQSAGCECAEQGWVLLPKGYRHTFAQEHEAALAIAVEALQIGERCGDADLVAFARNMQGRCLVRMGQVERGLALLDEAMLAASSGGLSPLITGLVYCSVIAGCHQVYAFDRAREWTSALASWCEAQPQLVSFTGTCQVHRAQLLQLGGAWNEAIEQARRAASAPQHAKDPTATAEAFYQEGEIHRLRGEYERAEAAYRCATEHGGDPQPGLALLRLMQGRAELGVQAVKRALAGTTGAMRRARYLPALVEITLAAGDLESAQAGSDELARIAIELGGDVLGAMAAHARGALLLAENEPGTAVEPLRAALRVWQQLDAPYIAAKVRVLLSQACAQLGDVDGSVLERDAARAIFERLGAQPDVAASAGAPAGEPSPTPPTQHNLSPRELEVLRLVAAGKTNKQIARELGLSEKTIDRHVSNIFAKLDVGSRTAATRYALEHGLA